MKFRHARHTHDLQQLTDFYTKVIGLEVLGQFSKHDKYSGVFLGFPGRDWHLEFTVSDTKPDHHPDADDLMVFYLQAQEELDAIRKDAEKWGAPLKTSANPYWRRHGVELKDPDGFGVILSVESQVLVSDDPITRLAQSQGVTSWDDLLRHIRHLPYGRTTSRGRWDEVLSEGKGTCSSKHALVKHLADKNGIREVQLFLGIYKMNEVNTPGIGSHLSENGLDNIPEAHCYIRANGKRIDLTRPASDIRNLREDILLEQSIEPFQVVEDKVQIHKRFIEEWIEQENISFTSEQIWVIRELCIQELSNE